MIAFNDSLDLPLSQLVLVWESSEKDSESRISAERLQTNTC